MEQSIKQGATKGDVQNKAMREFYLSLPLPFLSNTLTVTLVASQRTEL